MDLLLVAGLWIPLVGLAVAIFMLVRLNGIKEDSRRIRKIAEIWAEKNDIKLID